MANMEGAMVWHGFALKDEELIGDYLEPKVSNINHVSPIGTYDDFYSIHPDTLHGTYPLIGPEDSWYFYMARDTKYPNGCQDKVQSAQGYWKVCNASKRVKNIGFKRRLNFRYGSVNSSKPSQWFMEEFGLKQFVPYTQDNDCVLLKIYKEDGNAVTPPSTTASSFPLPQPQSFSSGIPTTFSSLGYMDFGGPSTIHSSPTSSLVDTRLSSMEAARTGLPYPPENFIQDWSLADHDNGTWNL